MDNGEVRRGDLAIGRRWTFGPAVLDERSLELSVHGSLARIERKPLEVLLYLLHHAGEVVTKEELAENLWPGRILTETVLTRCISQLRQVLRDEERKIIRTIHGFGYRLVAEVRVDTSTAPPVQALALKAGEVVAARPPWRLEERLGTGGHGEAWLARHEKTHEARVFKFALDANALASLKREITLSRLLADTLGERGAIAKVLEWNLEEPPYFLETEYVPSRDVRAWADANGGLAGMPLERRLELAAQIAEALAAAHSVGVLHKDMKPGNVLVAHDAAGQPQIRLCDFGSGGVLDTARLEALGITNLGVNTAGTSRDTSGTALYLAPEVLAGQPFTVAADIYALGVMLYQLAVGDLRKALAPGWELDVADELLREDIALAAAGDPKRRLADAGQLAERLRTREERAQVRAAEAAARERAERTRRVMAELRRTRVFAVAVLVLATAAVAGGYAAYRAQAEAVAARATAEAVNDFLMNDVLGVDPAVERPRDASYESLLNRAAAQVDVRFKDQPEAAARVHWLVGQRYRDVGHVELATVQYEGALAVLPKLEGDAALPALLALSRLIPIYFGRGKIAEMGALSDRLVERWSTQFGPADLSTILLRARMARMLGLAGQVQRSEAELRAVLRDLPLATPATAATRTALQEWLGFALGGDMSLLATEASLVQAISAHAKAIYAEHISELAQDNRRALPLFREALTGVTGLFPEDSEIVAGVRFGLANCLARIGQFDEALEHLQSVRRTFESSVPAKHWLHGIVGAVAGLIEVERNRPEDAITALQKAQSHCLENGCPPQLIDEIDYQLGRAHDLKGDLRLAIDLYRRTLTTCETLVGSGHVACLGRRLSLADTLRRTGKTEEVSTILLGMTPGALEALAPRHLVVAEYKRVQGLLWAAGPKRLDGQAALTESLSIVKQLFDENHWRTKRAQMELNAGRNP